MKPIGGELSTKGLSESIFFTDSGRSSLRLFVRSGNQNKKFLIPDFFCEVIENIFIQEKVSYEFYHILEDLTIDIKSILDKEFDVFYNINYFGQLNNIKSLNIYEKIVIEDNVFFYNFENVNNFKYWFGFNSFRKISSLADGSLIKTNLDIDYNKIIQSKAEFVESKYKAKNLKFEYLKNNTGSENEYIKLFEEGERLLHNQRDIYNISLTSIFKIMEITESNEQNISKEYYEFLFQEFQLYCLNKNVKFYSYFAMKVPNRNELRKYLFSNKIYLPIHWPQSTQKNTLYNNIISIPIFSNYSMDNMIHIAKTIKEFYEKYR